MDEGHVGFFDRAAFKLAGEAPVGLVGFGDEDQAGGVAVKAVDDAGPPGIAAGGECGVGQLGVVEEGVDEGAGPVAAGGVDDEAGLLVEGDEMLIFIDDVQGDVFGEGLVGGGVGRVTLTVSPERRTVEDLAGLPLTMTMPALTSFCSMARE